MEDPQLQEIYQLVRENNRMLHAMRRGAFWGGLFKFIIYAAFLLAPIWFYQQYMSQTVQQLLGAMQTMQSSGAQAQANLSGIQDALKKAEQYLPSLPKGQ